MTVTRKGCACMTAQSDISIPFITYVISISFLDISLEGGQGGSGGCCGVVMYGTAEVRLFALIQPFRSCFTVHMLNVSSKCCVPFKSIKIRNTFQ